ncbi:MAG TPA: choice-of-anchor Q domain-containing protein [Dokdonella sp.]|uniref:choice-of-anchor Q domain-containing protein n=1 Tax=Dokdonella sp. TaxID=2291710 RepID=UPI002D7F4C6E|nr:choice-of-anchor Q domain-containing protein [Dokdonella sp.]HET9032967.1 choice-of-anchor Q domain-containing protein [Dokdonella sp.]
MRPLIAALALALVCLLPLTARGAIITINVTSAANSGPNTLRQAIIDGNALQANNNVPRILIDLDSSTPILLTSALPTMTASYFEIKGIRAGQAVIDGAGAHRILTSSSSVLLFSLKNIRLFNGYSTTAAAACLDMPTTTSSGFANMEDVWFQNCVQSTPGIANGGAIRTGNNLTIKNALFQFNASKGISSTQGGAIAVFGDSDLTIRVSRFYSNRAESNGLAGSARASGGAIFMLNGKSITIEDSVFSDNDARTPNDGGPGIRFGGALDVSLDGKLSLLRTALVSNDAGEGGAIYHTGPFPGNPVVEMRNVSAFDNRAMRGNGGVLLSNSQLILYNNTFWRNSASLAGDNLAGQGNAQISAAYNNLFAAGIGAGDSCTGYPAISSGYNIVPAIECGLGGGGTDIISNDLHIRGAYIGPGQNFTVQLYSSSPAFDAGNPLAPSDTTLARCTTTDFLSRPRPADASGTGATPRCDIGALEAQSEPSLFIDDFEPRWLRP